MQLSDSKEDERLARRVLGIILIIAGSAWFIFWLELKIDYILNPDVLRLVTLPTYFFVINFLGSMASIVLGVKVLRKNISIVRAYILSATIFISLLILVNYI